MRRRREQLLRPCLDVSIHAPWEGCDISSNSTLSSFPRFNSRTLGRVRPLLYQIAYSIRVSIHAPWEGCDSVIVFCQQLCDRFNSRTLGRVRRRRQYIEDLSVGFQFTHPGKGATAHFVRFSLSSGVSIHAPWEGCDNLSILPVAESRPFQFTHPGKGATRMQSLSKVTYYVSIHAPWEGCDDKDAATLTASLPFQFTHPGKGATDTICSQ